MTHIYELGGFISYTNDHIHRQTSSYCHKSVTKSATLRVPHQCISKNNHEVTKWLISDHPLHPLCSIHPFSSSVTSSFPTSWKDFWSVCSDVEFNFTFFLSDRLSSRSEVHEDVHSQRLIWFWNLDVEMLFDQHETDHMAHMIWVIF